MVTIILIACFLSATSINAQSPAGRATSSIDDEYARQMQFREMLEAAHNSQTRHRQQVARDQAVKEYFFADSFNQLVKKLTDFAEKYNSGKVDAKAVKEVKKAWSKMQSNSEWFKNVDNSKRCSAQ